MLKAPKAWLQDSARQYPVTIDPTWSQGASDTWVQSDVPGSKAGDTELRVGTFNGGALASRSYLRFESKALNGKKISKAELRMYNYHSYSCSSSPIKVQRVTKAWESTDVRWSNQPSATTSGEGSLNVSKGYNSSCGAGQVYYPITAIAQHWADNPTQNFGVKLSAQDEKNNNSWKRYYSANYVEGETTSKEPLFVVTYVSYPGAPSAVSFNSGEAAKDASGKTWVRTKTPTFRASVSDPDKVQARAGFDLSGGATWNKQVGNYVKPSGVSTYKGTLEEGKTYTTKAWTSNYHFWSKSAGPSLTFTVDSTTPTLPGITSSGGITYNSWMDKAPASNVFSFSSSADTDRFEYSKNGGSWTKLTASAGKASLNWNPTGANQLQIKAIDKAGNVSAVRTLTWGNGTASLTSPSAGQTTSDAFKVSAQGPVASSGAVTPTVYWREANSVAADATQYGSTDGWYEAATLPAIAQGQAVKVDTMVDVAASPANKLKELGKDRLATLVEIQVCFEYAGAPSASKLQCTTSKTQSAVQATKLPHAFGDNYPTASAGDGEVALTTGELNMSETDVEVDAGNTGLSVSRSYSSYSGIGANSKIFGSGWRANIDGPEEGLSGLMVVESTALDGTITLINDDETAAIFRQTGNGKVSSKTGVYAAANEDAEASGWKVELAGSGASARIKITEEDGTVTTFKKGSKLENNDKIYEWPAEQVTGGNGVGTSKFVTDSAGRTTMVIAGTETNLSCDTATPQKGCRRIELAYSGSGKVTKVSYTAWDPIANKLATVGIAEYGYDGVDANAKLTSVKDVRTGDVTNYGYNGVSAAGVPLIASTEEKTSGGARVDAPTYYEYGQGNNTSGRSDWLEAVKRGNPSNGNDKLQLARFVYGVPVTGDDASLPKLSAEQVRLWGQGSDDRPVTGFAVFGPGKDVNTSKAVGVGAGDWKYADLQFVDPKNRVVNTASYASGAWQKSATILTNDGKVERSYDARAIRTIEAAVANGGELADDGALSTHADQASVNIYYGATQAEQEVLDTFVDEDGNGIEPATGTADEKAAKKALNQATAAFLKGYVTNAYSEVTTDENGTPARVRTKNHYTSVTDVDAGGMPRMLTTKVITTKAAAGEVDLDATGEAVLSEVANGYDAFETDKEGRAATDKANLRSGWVSGSPTKVTTYMAGAGDDIVVETRLDDQGRTADSRQPGSSGNDAGKTSGVYYSAGPNADDSACGNKPEFAGYLCKSTPQGAGSVAKHQTGFNIYGQPAEFTESSTGTDGAKRTTKQSYRSDGQELTTTVSTTGLAGSEPLQAITKLYDANGVQNGTREEAGNGKPATEVKWVQDLWGRTTGYTNSLGEVSTTEYDGFGNVTKTVTPKTTTTYKYGALSGDGDAEFQGVVTSMSISNHGGTSETGTYTANYDGDGNLLTQSMPGGFSQVQAYDESGKPTTLSYSGPVKDMEGNTTTATWMSWETVRDVTGRIVGENTPEGDVLTGSGTEGDRGASYDRGFKYDRAGRLTQVTDVTAPAGETINKDDAEGATTPVTVRKYTFDKNGNRTSLTTDVDGTQTAKRTWDYDAADRVGVSGGYVYDGLGRQTTIPAIDAPKTSSTPAGEGAIKIGYYDDDAAHTITRGGTTTTIERDTAGRRLNLTTGASKEVKHYTDDSDNPSWTTRTEGPKETLTRYESTIGGDLALTITDDVVELTINNPHGDTVTTIPLTGDEAGKGIKGWAQYDEYGNQTTDPVGTGATTYGWHGADQRALDASGLILMGARLYNSVTGLFTSRDPIDGGNTTTYTQPQDPIGANDISGLFSWGDAWTAMGTMTSWMPGGIAVNFATGMSAASAYTKEGRRRDAAGAAVSSLAPWPPVYGPWIAGGVGKRLWDVGHKKSSKKKYHKKYSRKRSRPYALYRGRVIWAPKTRGLPYMYTSRRGVQFNYNHKSKYRPSKRHLAWIRRGHRWY